MRGDRVLTSFQYRQTCPRATGISWSDGSSEQWTKMSMSSSGGSRDMGGVPEDGKNIVDVVVHDEISAVASGGGGWLRLMALHALALLQAPRWRMRQFFPTPCMTSSPQLASALAMFRSNVHGVNTMFTPSSEFQRNAMEVTVYCLDFGMACSIRRDRACRSSCRSGLGMGEGGG